MSRKRPKVSAVVNGKVNYLSPSAITTADPSQFGGCLRRWHWKYVAKKREDSTAAQSLGTEIHTAIEDYLLKDKTFVKKIKSIVRPGMEYIDKLKGLRNLRVEEYTVHPHKLETAILRILGVPFYGLVDINHDESPAIPEALDWKSSSNIVLYAKSGFDLKKTVQMAGYGKWLLAKYKQAEAARLTHVYFQTRGKCKAKKSTIIMPGEEIDKEWTRIEGVVQKILDAAKEKDSNDVEANTRACDAYRGCPHRSYCTAGDQQVLVDMFGRSGAMNLAQELEKLKKEEQAVMPNVLETFASIRCAGKGLPALGGEAAKAYAAAKGEKKAPHGYAGSGTLAVITIDTVARLEELDLELKKIVDTDDEPTEPCAPVLLPPDAPASNPVAATPPAESPAQVAAPPAEDEKPGKKTRKKRASKVAVGIVSHMVYVDCIPTVLAVESIEPYVRGILDRICKSQKVPDIRCAPDDNKHLSYGKWKGALTAVIKDDLPEPGRYFIDTNGNDIMAVVADALGAYVVARGVR